MEILIRNERAEDFRAVEEVTREAFWNLYAPGCSEHYIVHTLREHKDFIRELDFVAIVKLQISPAYECSEGEVADFDKRFPPKEKGRQCSQEIFAIAVRAFLR